jgi:rhodanese-related sulfurtransferase
MDIEKKRTPKREKAQMVPQTVKGEDGLVKVDTSWGKIQPMRAHENVRTVDEIELHKYLEQKWSVVDARTPDFYKTSTIPGSKNIPHTEIVSRIRELDKDRPTIFFCNGPQCPQSPTAIKNLLAAGYPAEMILYYRGGMHDWVTLGLPIEEGK